MASISTLLLNSHDVALAAPSLARVIDLVEGTYALDAEGKVEVPTKIGVHPHGDSFLHAMPAWVAGHDTLGMKWVSYFPGNTDGALPQSSALIILNDPRHGLPIAIIEAMQITYARTAACAALAARYCANPKATRLGLVGCGGLGEWSLRALSVAFPSIQEVFVSSAHPESREAFCSKMAQEGSWRLTPVDNVQDAVSDMDIVVSSVPKLTKHPIKGEWWTPGTLLIPLDVTGAWDDATWQRADHLVCDHGDNLQRALDRYRPGIQLDSKRMVPLQDLVFQPQQEERFKQGRTMAFMTGIGSLDMVVAQEIYREALSKRLGTPFTLRP